MKKLFALLAISVAITTGCASMSHGIIDRIKIVTLEDKSASTTCEAINEEGKWQATPLSDINIHRDGNPLDVSCKNQTQSGTASVMPNFEGSYLALDLLLDLCIISCIVDGANNAFYDYPDSVIVKMTP